MAKKNPTKSFGKNVRTLRRTMMLTQLQFAHLLGYKGRDAGAYVSRIEAGKRMPRLGTLLRIADTLGTTLEALIAK